MEDLFSYQQPAIFEDQAATLSVTEASELLRHVVEESFANISIEGEISTLRTPASGHVYFNLKDEKSSLKSIMWRGTATRLKHQFKEGDKVIAHGRLTTYGARSEYQIIIEKIEPAGLGDLMRRLEELKAKFASEGLFDEDRKQKIPYLPAKIGVVTSPTGAVISDILHRLKARCGVHVQLWPTLVQGEGAAEKIATAIDGFNRMPESQRPQVLIVARGGGSLEDLWAFNEEVVVRAVANSNIPLISGVGHEPDTTLIDYVADLRAPTPTGAAEMAVPVKSELAYSLDLHRDRLVVAINNTISNNRKYIESLRRGLPDVKRELEQAKLKLLDREDRFSYACKNYLKQNKQALDNLNKLLISYSPQSPLKRGYAYITAGDELLRSAKTKATEVTLHFHDGQREATLK